MSTNEIIFEISKLNPAQRLATIEAALRLLRNDLSSARDRDQRMRAAAAALRDEYLNNPELTSFTSLDAEDLL